jgi:ribosomal protein S18 acetylase RimI-like enzyme
MNRLSPQKLKIRDMTIHDLAKVYRIGESVFTKESNVFLYRTWDTYEVTGLFSTDPELCIVASVAGQVVGFALASVIEKPRSPWLYGYLVWTGVKRKFQRYRIGKKLYQEVERRAKRAGARMMIIDTEGTNAAAIGFFARVGFVRGSEHLWMTKTLSRKRRYLRH